MSVPCGATQGIRKRFAFRFVMLIGILSFFADFTYEGSRSIIGPFLSTLGSTGLIVGLVTGFGELAGYGLRLGSGWLTDKTRQYWPLTIFGYALQMTSVPALALAPNWQVAAILIVLERVGKAIRNPPRDVMLSHAAKDMGGFGWVFGLHEALDQCGAMVGPLVAAAILALRGSYRLAFGVLLVPAIINVILVVLARFLYPRPYEMDSASHERPKQGEFPLVFWIYLAGSALVASGFADFPLIAFHFTKSHVVPAGWIAVFYAIAMGASGAGSLVFGRLFDRFGFPVLIIVTVLSAGFAPLVFLGGFRWALLGTVIWGLGMGVQESIIPAAVAPMVAQSRRASAFGLFTAGYGTFWFLGSGVIGLLYDRSLRGAVIFCIVAELAAVPFFLWVTRRFVAVPKSQDVNE